MPTRAPRCGTTGPAAAWTGTPPTSSPLTSQALHDNRRTRPKMLRLAGSRQAELAVDANHPCGDAQRPQREREPPLWPALTRAISSARGRHNGAFCAQRPVNENLCVTCGGTSRLLHGYVYDDNAHGICFLEWCDGDHPHSSAFLTISLDAFHQGGDAHYRKRVQHRVAAG